MLTRIFIACASVVTLGVGLMAEGVPVHLEGCVYFEKTMSAERPAPSEASRRESYVLTDTKILAGDTDDGRILKLDAAAEDRVRSLVGKRVGVTGRIEDATDMPELRVTSIREIVGGCRPSATRS